MRSRNIKPGLWKDEELAALPIEARYLFPGLWCLADCKGRIEDRPRLIKSELFPFDDHIGAAKVHHLLDLLHGSDFIQRYEVDGKRYIQVTNFEKHQNPHKQERDKGSQIPDPPLVEPHQKKTEVVPIKTEADQKNAESLAMIPDSGLLITDTLIPDVRMCGKSAPTPIREVSRTDYQQRYEALYARHPVPGYKNIGQVKYLEILSQAVNPETVADAIDREHLAWCQFWEANPTERKPGIGYYFEDGYYMRKPQARDSPPRRERVCAQPPPLPKATKEQEIAAMKDLVASPYETDDAKAFYRTKLSEMGVHV